MTCPNEAHVHRSPTGAFTVRDGDGSVIAATAHKHYAHRIAELVNLHGVADIPDDVSALVDDGRSLHPSNGDNP